MPRRLLVLLVVSLAVLAVVAARPMLFPPTNPNITLEKYERIKLCMTLVDVEAVLGPPGDYRTGPSRPPTKVGTIHAFPCKGDIKWTGDDHEIWVCPGRGGAVAGWCFRTMEPEQAGLLDLLRWRWDHWLESRR
jgi:hypothetical protein